MNAKTKRVVSLGLVEDSMNKSDSGETCHKGVTNCCCCCCVETAVRCATKHQND